MDTPLIASWLHTYRLAAGLSTYTNRHVYNALPPLASRDSQIMRLNCDSHSVPHTECMTVPVAS